MELHPFEEFRRKHGFEKSQLVHFLHIGKTGGTSIKDALVDRFVCTNHVLFLHRHPVRLKDIPRGQQVVFFVRDPISRFVSGFYSRQRQGKPRYFGPWSREEKAAFKRFGSPDELGTALSSRDPEVRKAAVSAMRSINHVKSHYWDWFGNRRYFLGRIGDVMLCGRQETLSRDFERLKKLLDLPRTVRLPRSEVRMHKTPSHLDRRLSRTARSNLRKWYERDYEFVHICREERLFGRR